MKGKIHKCSPKYTKRKHLLRMAMLFMKVEMLGKQLKLYVFVVS